MSLENLKAFLGKAKGDSRIQEKLKAAKQPEEVVAIANEHGYEFTADKLSQLNQNEIEAVAGGGADATKSKPHAVAGLCWCGDTH